MPKTEPTWPNSPTHPICSLACMSDSHHSRVYLHFSPCYRYTHSLLPFNYHHSFKLSRCWLPGIVVVAVVVKWNDVWVLFAFVWLLFFSFSFSEDFYCFLSCFCLRFFFVHVVYDLLFCISSVERVMSVSMSITMRCYFCVSLPLATVRHFRQSSSMTIESGAVERRVSDKQK